MVFEALNDRYAFFILFNDLYLLMKSGVKIYRKGNAPTLNSMMRKKI